MPLLAVNQSLSAKLSEEASGRFSEAAYSYWLRASITPHRARKHAKSQGANRQMLLLIAFSLPLLLLGCLVLAKFSQGKPMFVSVGLAFDFLQVIASHRSLRPTPVPLCYRCSPVVHSSTSAGHLLSSLASSVPHPLHCSR